MNASILGIDVSKATLHLALLKGSAIADLVGWVEARNPTLTGFSQQSLSQLTDAS